MVEDDEMGNEEQEMEEREVDMMDSDGYGRKNRKGSENGNSER